MLRVRPSLPQPRSRAGKRRATPELLVPLQVCAVQQAARARKDRFGQVRRRLAALLVLAVVPRDGAVRGLALDRAAFGVMRSCRGRRSRVRGCPTARRYRSSWSPRRCNRNCNRTSDHGGIFTAGCRGFRRFGGWRDGVNVHYNWSCLVVRRPRVGVAVVKDEGVDTAADVYSCACCAWRAAARSSLALALIILASDFSCACLSGRSSATRLRASSI